MKTANFLRTAGFAAALTLSLSGALAQDSAKADAKSSADKKPAKHKHEAKPAGKSPADAKKAPSKAAEKKSSSAKVEVRVRAADKKPVEKPKADKKPGAVALMRPASEHRHLWKPRPWLGIAMRDVPPSLREYLDIDEGFGVQVEHVVEDSPAHKAGLAPHDVITRLDDQHIISPEHVALLVRSKKKGAKIDVTYVRKGKEQQAQITLGEKALPPFSNAPMRAAPQPPRPGHHGNAHGHGGDHHRSVAPKPDSGRQDGHFELRFGEPGKQGHLELRLPGDAMDYQELRREFESWGGMIQKWMEENPEALRFDWKGGEMKMRPFDPPKPVEPKKDKSHDHSKDKDASAKPKPIPSLPGKDNPGKPPAIMVNPGYPLSVVGNAGIVKIDNPKGEVTITSDDEGRRITIKNEDGETVYEGPYKDGPKSLPKEAQEQLKVMKLNNLQILMDRSSIQIGPGRKADTPPAKPKTKVSPKANDKSALL